MGVDTCTIAKSKMVSHGRQWDINHRPKLVYYTFWNFRTMRVHRHWCNCHFQNSTTARCRWRHGEWMVRGWPETLIHVHGCNRPGQYGPKLVNNIWANSLHMEFIHSSKARILYCPSEMSHCLSLIHTHKQESSRCSSSTMKPSSSQVECQ